MSKIQDHRSPFWSSIQKKQWHLLSRIRFIQSLNQPRHLLSKSFFAAMLDAPRNLGVSN